MWATSAGLIAAISVLLAPPAARAADDLPDYSFTITGAAGSALTVVTDVDVDNSAGPTAGTLYAADTNARRVVKYGRDGSFLLMFGPGVDKTDGGDVCTAASAHACGIGLEPEGESSPRPELVAVDDSGGASSGSVYASYRHLNHPLSATASVSKFTSDGALIADWQGGSADFGAPVSGMAVAPDGRLYVLEQTTPPTLHPFEPDGAPLPTMVLAGEGTEIEFDAGGLLYLLDRDDGVRRYSTAGADLGLVDDEGGTGLAIDPSEDHLYVLRSWQATYPETIARIDLHCPACPPTIFGHHYLGGDGLAVDGTDHTVYVSGSNLYGRGVAVYRASGVVPDVTNGPVIPEGESAARFHGFVDGDESGLTGCRLEYVERTVLEESRFDEAETATCEPTEGDDAHAVSARMEGLALDTRYYYRLVAESEKGPSVTEMGEFGMALPKALVEGPLAVQPTSALLTGVADPGGWGHSITACRFLVAPEKTFFFGGFARATEHPCSPPPDYVNRTDVTLPLFNLDPGTSYRYRLEVSNSVGSDFAEASFETGGALDGPLGAPPVPLPEVDEPQSELLPEGAPGDRGHRVRCTKRACVQVLEGGARPRTWSSPRFPMTYGWLINLHKKGRQLSHSELEDDCRSTFSGYGIHARLSACEGRFRLRYSGRGRFTVRWRVFEFCRCGETTKAFPGRRGG